jgi:hypothetical protein
MGPPDPERAGAFPTCGWLQRISISAHANAFDRYPDAFTFLIDKLYTDWVENIIYLL